MSFVRMQTESRELNQVQSNLATVLNPIIDNPLMAGAIYENVALASGDNTIYPKLGRNVQGWFIVSISAAATIYDKQRTSTDLTKLVLNSSAAVTANIYIF